VLILVLKRSEVFERGDRPAQAIGDPDMTYWLDRAEAERRGW
jgi:hypothetical protein